MYVIVHYPKIDTAKIQAFRKKYDPLVNLIKPHITVVFTIPESEDKEKIIKHISNVVSQHKKIKVHLKNLIKAWDHWLFLVPGQGSDEIIKLHDDLYSGILGKYLRTDIEFIPHVAIGLFTKKDNSYSVFDPKKEELDEKLYEKALAEAEALNLDYVFELDKVTLVELNHDNTKIVDEQEFLLGKNWGEL